MTDPTERDPTLPPAADETDATELVADAAETAPDEGLKPLDAEDDISDDEYEAPGTGVAGGSAVAGARGAGARGRAGARSPFASGSSPSDIAVHVGDSTSTAFVVVVVLAFVAIFAYGLIGGVGGFLTPIPTIGPAPSGSLQPSAGPSGSLAPSAGPSASSGPSGSPAASGAASPSAGPSGGSPVASTSPGASPSAAAASPSPSPAASPSG